MGENRDKIFSNLFSTASAQSEATEHAELPLSPEIAGEEFLQFLESKKFLKYSDERWRKVRARTEDSVSGGGVIVSTQPRPAPPPLPPGLAVDLPYESQLSISGRKMIGVSYKQTLYDVEDPQKRKNSGSFDMQQELQVRINGRVGRKIKVNVDFDDTTADKRDISVVYKGDPDEVIQEAAFGDISMSLPSTEFVGYSRQLFGIKVDAKPSKDTRVWGFFSRTKGLSEVKRFTGNTKLERRTILDTGYIAYKYYSLKWNAADVIKPGTVRIYRDDRISTNNNITCSTDTVVEILTPATTTYTGDFDLLVPGQDYTVDYNRGIVIFRSKPELNQVIAVDYQKSDDTWLSQGGTYPGTWKVLKDAANTPGTTKELKTFYSLGNLKIIRDNGRGNFILKVQDLNANTPGTLEPGSLPVPTYPSDITVDFDNGVFNFEPADGQPFPADLYTSNQHRYNILTEYRYRIKFITLRPGLVPQSERVVVDGKQLQRDAEYFIDYDAGIVTFFNEEKINENTVIDVSYDYAPFGSAGGSTLIGTRIEAALTKNLFIGSSFIYDFAAKTQTVPDIRTTPSSLMVWEGDTKIQNIQIPYTPMTMTLGGEYAFSERNPNIMNKAILESMEGIKQEDSASLNYESWIPGTNPTLPGYYLDDIQWVNEEFNLRDINPKIDPKRDEKTQVLSISYNLTRSTEMSIVQSLSTVGIDFSKKVYLESWIYGDGKGEDLTISYGSFNEDINGNNKLVTEDLNNDGTLNPGEDSGWDFINPDGSVTKVGAKNGKLDSEDLDKDGVLKRYDTTVAPSPYGAGAGKTITDSDGITYSAVTWTGWKFFKIPLLVPSGSMDWQNIKQVRITIKGANKQQGNVKIESLTLVNFRWEPSGTFVAGSTLTVSAVNTDDTPAYSNNSLLNNVDYQTLYDITSDDTSSKREQALSLSYTNTLSTSVTLAARLLYTRSYDISNYHYMKFFVFGNSGNQGDVFFLQAGNDANYFEYAVPISWTGWRLITVTQFDVNKDNKPDRWALGNNGEMTDGSGATVAIHGSPSLQNISQLKLGVRTTGPKTAEIWVNEIFMTDSWIKKGYAWRANADFTLPNWATFGGKRKIVDRNFETFSAGIYNRDYLEDSSYLNINRISFLPINTSFGKTRTITPSVVQNQNDLLSINDEGKVISFSGSGSSSLNPGDPLNMVFKSIFGSSPNLGKYFPRFSGSYSRSITDSQQISRLEDNESVSGSAEYPLPIRFALFPTNLSANYGISNSFFRVYPSTRIVDTNDFVDIDTFKEYLKIEDFHTKQISENWGLRAPFQFWNGFSFSPSYALSKTREDNRDILYNYPKSANQNVGASSNLKVFQWMQPSFSYNVSIGENYALAYNTTSVPAVYPAKTKTIDRSSSGDVTWNFQVRDFIDFKYTQSLGFSSSYRIQDSDSYDNVSGTYPVLGFDRLWIRNSPLTQGTTNLAYRSLLRKDDKRFSGRYNPFEAFDFTGRVSAIKTFSMNGTYAHSLDHSEQTGTIIDSFTETWPDVIFGLSQWEKLLFLERWLGNTQINVSHQKRYTERKKINWSQTKNYGGDLRYYLLKTLDMNFGLSTGETMDWDIEKNVRTNLGNTLSWNGSTGFYLGKWRLTLRYDNSDNWARDGTEKLTSQLITRTYTTQIYSDMSFPGGVPIPFTKKTLPLTNRLIFNTNLNYSVKSSNLNVEKDNTNTYGVNSSADYEISSNFRAAFGLGWSRIENREKPDENYSTIEGSGRLTIQF